MKFDKLRGGNTSALKGGKRYNNMDPKMQFIIVDHRKEEKQKQKQCFLFKKKRREGGEEVQ